MENIGEIIRRFLVESILGDKNAEELTVELDLKGSGILDSLSTLRLVSFLEQRFDLSFEAAELDEKNFSSISRIERLIVHKSGKPLPGM